MNTSVYLMSTLTMLNTFITTVNNFDSLCRGDSDDIVAIKNMVKMSSIDEKTKRMRERLALTNKQKDEIDTDIAIGKISEIEETIKDIQAELAVIQYRIEYNESLYVNIRWRRYRFNNCLKRLESHINTFDKQYSEFMLSTDID